MQTIMSCLQQPTIIASKLSLRSAASQRLVSPMSYSTGRRSPTPPQAIMRGICGMPFGDTQANQQVMDQMLRQCLGLDCSGSQSAAADFELPLAVDAAEEGSTYVFRADIPGVLRENLKVQDFLFCSENLLCTHSTGCCAEPCWFCFTVEFVWLNTTRFSVRPLARPPSRASATYWLLFQLHNSDQQRHALTRRKALVSASHILTLVPPTAGSDQGQQTDHRRQARAQQPARRARRQQAAARASFWEVFAAAPPP